MAKRKTIKKTVPQTTRVKRHIDKICKEAGLGIMAEIFEITLDRVGVKNRHILALDSTEVSNLYDAHIGPAIDSLEYDLMEN